MYLFSSLPSLWGGQSQQGLTAQDLRTQEVTEANDTPAAGTDKEKSPAGSGRGEARGQVCTVAKNQLRLREEQGSLGVWVEKMVKVNCNVEAKKVTVQVSEHWFQKQNKKIYKYNNSYGSQSSLFEGSSKYSKSETRLNHVVLK